jgi:hypothetical protein
MKQHSVVQGMSLPDRAENRLIVPIFRCCSLMSRLAWRRPRTKPWHWLQRQNIPGELGRFARCLQSRQSFSSLWQRYPVTACDGQFLQCLGRRPDPWGSDRECSRGSVAVPTRSRPNGGARCGLRQRVAWPNVRLSLVPFNSDAWPRVSFRPVGRLRLPRSGIGT